MRAIASRRSEACWQSKKTTRLTSSEEPSSKPELGSHLPSPSPLWTKGCAGTAAAREVSPLLRERDRRGSQKRLTEIKKQVMATLIQREEYFTSDGHSSRKVIREVNAVPISQRRSARRLLEKETDSLLPSRTEQNRTEQVQVAHRTGR